MRSYSCVFPISVYRTWNINQNFSTTRRKTLCHVKDTACAVEDLWRSSLTMHIATFMKLKRSLTLIWCKHLRVVCRGTAVVRQHVSVIQRSVILGYIYTRGCRVNSVMVYRSITFNIYWGFGSPLLRDSIKIRFTMLPKSCSWQIFTTVTPIKRILLFQTTQFRLWTRHFRSRDAVYPGYALISLNATRF